jgi:hypothetical protein
MAHDLVDGRRKIDIAGDVDLPPCALVAGCKPQHEPGAEPHRGGGNSTACGGSDLAAWQDGERNRKREYLEACGLAGVARERIARPARASQEVIDKRSRRGVDRGGPIQV